jgi:hypothetical protein
MALASDKRADLDTAMFDLNGVSQQLSEVMLSKQGAGKPDAASGIAES